MGLEWTGFHSYVHNGPEGDGAERRGGDRKGMDGNGRLSGVHSGSDWRGWEWSRPERTGQDWRGSVFSFTTEERDERAER